MIELPVGRTVAEIVALVQPDPLARDLIQVRIGDEPVPQAMWRFVRPRPGHLVQVALVPGQGNVLRTVLTVAVVITAMAAAPYLAPYLGVFGASAVAASISVGGMLAINALVPPAAPKIAEALAPGRSNALTGGGNRARPNEAIPRVLGFHRMAPDLAAPWVTDLDGSGRVILCGLLCWGYGPLEVSELRIGETPIEHFRGVEIHTTRGDPGSLPRLALYPGIITPLVVQTRLSQATGWVSRTTAEETDAAVLELVLPQGGVKYGKKTQDRLGIEVDFEFAHRRVGTDDWFSDGTMRISAKTASPVRQTKRIAFPARGQFSVRVRRLTGDTNPDDNEENKVDESWWLAMRSHRYEMPVTKPGLCLTALRILSSDQLSGAIDNLTGMVKTVGYEWDKPQDRWVFRATNRPEALFRMILQGNGAKKPLADGKLDLPALQDWAEAANERQLRCNFVVDRGMSTWDALRLVCSAGRAMPTAATGKWSAIVDGPRPYPVQHFGPRNSRFVRGRRLFVDLPHALRVTFVDETNDWDTNAERYVYDDGRNAGNSDRFEDIEFPGVTHPSQIHKLARFRLAEAQLRQESFEIETGWDWLNAVRGDRVTLSTDVIEWSLGAGRVRVLNLRPDGLIGSIGLDAPIVVAPGLAPGGLALRVRTASSPVVEPIRELAVHLSDEDSDGGPVDTFVLDTPEAIGSIGTGDLVTLGARNEATVGDCLIQSITPVSDLAAKLTLIPYAPGVFNADTEAIPDWTPGSIASPGVEKPLILSIRSGETAGKRNSDGNLIAQVIVNLFDDGSRPLILIAAVELRWREADVGDAEWRFLSFPPEARELVITDAEHQSTIELMARYRRRDGRVGAWTSTERHTVIGSDVPPPNVPSIYVDGDRLSWLAPVPLPPDLAGYRLRWTSVAGLPWADALPLTDGLQTDTFIPLGAVPDSAKEMLVVAETTGGLISAVPARVAITPGILPNRVALDVVDYRARGWPGAKSGVEVQPDGNLAALDTNLFLQPPGGRFLTPGTTPWLAASWAKVAYTIEHKLPSLTREGDRVRLEMEAEGGIEVWYAWGTSSLQRWPEDQPIPESLFLSARATPDLPFGVFVQGGASSGTIERRVFAAGVFAPGVFAVEILGGGGGGGAPAPGLGVFEPDVFVEDVFVGDTVDVPSGASTNLRPWRLAISARPGELLRIQFRAPGGTGTRPRLTKLLVVLDAPELEEQVVDLPIPIGGRQVPLSKDWRRVDWIFGILRGGPSLRAGVLMVDSKDLLAGPLVRATDMDGNDVPVLADLRLGGA